MRDSSRVMSVRCISISSFVLKDPRRFVCCGIANKDATVSTLEDLESVGPS